MLPWPGKGTLSDVIAALGERLPALLGPVIEPGGRTLNAGYILNLNGRDFVPDLAREVQPGDAVLLIAAAAGGDERHATRDLGSGRERPGRGKRAIRA
jgi:hypothetical protein